MPMTIDYQTALALRDEGRRFSYSDRETMLYALAAGMGRDPLDLRELPYVFEGDGFRAMPTLAVVVARSNIARQIPFNLALMLHGEQRLTLYRPMPTEADLIADSRVREVLDKGEGKGALIYTETTARLAQSGEPLFTVGNTLFARGDGGFGGPRGPTPPVHAMPDRAPDHVHVTETRPDQALLYRLTGDRNPLHADPELARKAGFPVPILHGLCTYAVACRAVLATACGDDPAIVRQFDVRFTAPVFPGDRIETDVWIDGDVVSFRCRVPDRAIVAINNGRCVMGAAPP
jgi:acyl dehydratase